MIKLIFITLVFVFCSACSPTIGTNKSQLIGTWVSDKTTTLREAEKDGVNLPEGIRKNFGKSAYIVTENIITFTNLETPDTERNWFRWKISNETDKTIFLETGSAIRFAKQIKRYNKNVGCFEQPYTYEITDNPEHPGNFSYTHYYCKQSTKESNNKLNKDAT